ncbi:MAG: hypothetical protein WC179_05095 [Candidatus Cloacimonadaceae bacterium]
MGSSYPIWIDVEACIYKSSKSYGAKNTNSERVLVGTSPKHSHYFYTRSTTRKEFNEYRGFKNVTVFRGYHNAIVVDELVMCTKTKEVLERRSATIQGLT